MMNLIKKNIKFIVLMLVVIIFGIVGIAYAIKVANFNPIGLNVTSAPIDVNITYDSSANGASITSSGKMVPIDDSLITGVDVTDERVIKAKFNVAGVSSNPDNTIYDVALRDINIDCDLRTEDVKWRLYKNGTLLTSGNLSPTFDVMSDNRLVLTDTQQDLTTTTDEYVFLLWISESCTGDISTCSKEQEQNKYLNKFFSASIKLEMSTKAKKTLVRNTASADSCSFSTTSVPVFNSLTYNGSEQTLVNSGTGYTLINNTGTNAGEYVVTAKLNNGYKWTDGTTDDKVIKGKINKKTATVVADSQSISYGGSINSTKYTTLDFLSGHSVSSVFLNTSTVDVGVGTITPTSARIVDSKGNDVTDNYNLSYVSGTLTIDCSSSSNITIDLPSTLTYGTSGTYTYTVSPTNLLVSCTSSDTSIATCSVDTTNKKVTITPKGTGSVNITLNGEVPNSNDECSSVNISKAITINCSNTATEPIVTSSQDYTGSIRIGVSGGTNVDLGGTLSATDVGTYTGTATPSKGYCWSDNTNSSKSYNWTISKIADSITITSTTATYDGNPHPATAKSVSGTAVTLTYYSDSSCSTKTNTTNANSTGGAPKNAGIYYAIGETSGTNNYNASISSCTKAVTINKISPTISLSATSGDVNYNDTNTFTATTKSPISSNVAGTLTATSADTSYVTITGGASSSITATSSGVNTTITYKGVKGTNNSTAITIEFVPDDSTNFNTVTATYNVSKVSQLPGSISLSEKTATYTGSAIIANTATTNSGGTVTYVYYSDNSCNTKTATSTGASSEGEAPIDAGTYYVKATVASTDNYTSASTGCIKHTINKKSVAVTWGDTTTFTYNNTAQAPTATATSEITGETINVTRTTGTNAGSYTSTASCSSVTGGRAKCDNYNLTNSTKSFTINKATPTISLSATSGDVNYNDTKTFTATTKSPISSNVAGTLTATSGGTSYVTITGGASSSITATSSGVSTTITYKGAGGTTSATTITVKFTPSDTTNFNTVTKTYSVTAVNKIANTLSVTAKTGLSYNGSAQTLATVSNAQGTVYYSTSTELTSSNYSSGSTTISTGTNAGTYTVYYYTPGNNNYQAKSGSVSVTIAKVSPTISLSATSGDVNYNDTKTFTATTKSPISSNVAGTLTATSGGTSYVTITGGASSSITATSSGVSTTITYKGAGGTTSATTITVKFTPSDTTNFNTVTKTYSVTAVNKIASTCTISSTPTLKYPGSKTGTFSYSCTGDGSLSLTSSNTSVISVGTVGTTSTTLTAKATGSSTLTLKQNEGTNYLASSSVTKSITVSASTYTLTYNNNGGSGCSSKTVTYGSTYGTMCTPTRSGYIFVGWFDSSYKDAPLNYFANQNSSNSTIKACGTDEVCLYNYYYRNGGELSQYTSSSTYNTAGNKTVYAGWVKFNYLIEVGTYGSGVSAGYYNSLSAAVNGRGITINLLNDVTETSGYTFSSYGPHDLSYDIVIKLNGHTLTVPSLTFSPGSCTDNYPCNAYITGPGTITYTDSAWSGNYLINVTGGTLNLNGGSYVSNNMSSVIHVGSSGKVSFSDTEARLAIEANGPKACPTAILSEASYEMIIRAKDKGMYIYGYCYGISHNGILRVQSTYNNTSPTDPGVEMTVIGSQGYAITKSGGGSTQIGNHFCSTYGSCTSTETSDGKYGYYGSGNEMYPFIATYSPTTNPDSNGGWFEVIYEPVSSGEVWYYSGRLLTTKTGLSCTTYYDNDACETYFLPTTNVFKIPGPLTSLKYSSYSGPISSLSGKNGDNVTGTKLMPSR